MKVEATLYLEKNFETQAYDENEALRLVKEKYYKGENNYILHCEDDFKKLDLKEEGNESETPSFSMHGPLEGKDRYIVSIMETLQNSDDFEGKEISPLEEAQKAYDNGELIWDDDEFLVATDFKVTGMPKDIQYVENESGENIPVRDFDNLYKALKDNILNNDDNSNIIYVQDQSVENLREMNEELSLNNYKRLNAFEGHIGEDCVMLSAYGELKTTIKLEESNIYCISPSDSTYYDSALSEQGLDSGENDVSSFLHQHPQIVGGRVEYDVTDKTDLDNVLIEDVPYNEAIKLIYSLDIQDDNAFKRVADVYKSLPEEKRTPESVRQKITDEEKKYIEVDGKLIETLFFPTLNDSEYKNKYYINYDNHIEGNFHPKMKITNKPEKEWRKGFYILTKESLDFKGKDFISPKEYYSLKDGEIKKRISDVNLFKNNRGEMMMRCKIDGEQQMGKKINAELFRELSFKHDFLIAAKLFKEEMNEQQTIKMGLSR